MYDLITYQAGFGNVSYSPFCVKAVWMLNHAGVDWQREDCLDPRKFAHGKLPVLRAHGNLIHDSDDIRLFLEREGADFWGETPMRDQAMGRALIRMAEDHLYFHVVMDRWMNDDVWPHIKAAYFTGIPRLIRRPVTNGLRKALRKGLHAQGILRLSDDERLRRLDQDLDAIRTLLGQHAFILSDTPTLPDFSVAAVLSNIAASPVATPTSLRVAGDPVLMGYIARMKEMFD
ncbi:glutathione S-transferase family protein [Rhodobacteraceae bacterium S2214]|nr:glutathione S-transferase family protein [Rhodobacteraceae bacterium S2214]